MHAAAHQQRMQHAIRMLHTSDLQKFEEKKRQVREYEPYRVVAGELGSINDSVAADVRRHALPQPQQALFPAAAALPSMSPCSQGHTFGLAAT